MSTAIDQFVIDRVREMRKEHNMTQREFADAINLSSGYVGDIEARRGSVKYSLFHINEIAKVFKCSIWELLPEYPLN